MSWRSPRRAVLPLLVITLALTMLAASGATAEDGLEDGETSFVVELDADGDATWQIVERIELADSVEEAAFTEQAAAFEAGESNLAGVATIQGVIDIVDARTDRGMSLSGPERTSAIEGGPEDRTGTLTVSLTWENFAQVGGENDERLQVDDAFETGDGLWLPALTADQELRVSPPEGYSVRNAPGPALIQDGELRWEGPAEFDAETFAATFVGDGTDNGNGDEPNGDNGLGLVSVLVIVLGVAAVAAVLVGYRDRLAGVFDREPTAADGADDTGSEPSAAAETSHPDTATAGDGPDGVTGPAGGGIDEELLSDEERVERLLEQNGGRMKQADIVDETGWSNAKVSQLLSSMAEEGRVDKLRIGRENLISFPDVDVTDTENEP